MIFFFFLNLETVLNYNFGEKVEDVNNNPNRDKMNKLKKITIARRRAPNRQQAVVFQTTLASLAGGAHCACTGAREL